MADTLQVSVTFVAAENVSAVITQPGTSSATLPVLINPLFTFSQTVLPATGLFNAQRLTFTPSVSSVTVTPVGTHAMLVVDDPAFQANTGIQVSVLSGLTFYCAVNCGNPFAPYSSVPVAWPAIFRVPTSAITVRTESSLNVAAAPSVAFSATLYTW